MREYIKIQRRTHKNRRGTEERIGGLNVQKAKMMKEEWNVMKDWHQPSFCSIYSTLFTHHHSEQDSLLEHKHAEQQHAVKNPRKLSMIKKDKKIRHSPLDIDLKPY